MKHVLTVVFTVASISASSAQGLINFFNTATTLISSNPGQTGAYVPILAPVGSYEFALLTSPVGANTFSFAGLYATNTTTAGMINGGAGIAVPGWAAGTARDFAIYGWLPYSGAGLTFNPSWLNPDLSPGPNSLMHFGLSVVATGVAGGVTPSGTVATLDLFGPAGLQGFRIELQQPVPEPSSIALAGLGAVMLMLRQKRYLPGK